MTLVLAHPKSPGKAHRHSSQFRAATIIDAGHSLAELAGIATTSILRHSDNNHSTQ
jgi:hypothetical protein